MTVKNKSDDDINKIFSDMMTALDGCSYDEAMLIVRNIEFALRKQSIVKPNVEALDFSDDIKVYK